MEKIQLKLILPDQTLIDKQVAMVVLPGEAGDLGVLKGHVAMVVSLRSGCVCTFDERTSTPERYYVNNSIAEILPDCCTLLCEEAEPFAEINEASLTVALQSVTEQALRQRLSQKIALIQSPPYG